MALFCIDFCWRKDNPTHVDRPYSIKDLVDIDRLRTIFEGFAKLTGFTVGFVSYPEQELLIAAGWRDVCTKFHRACPISSVHCKESNIYLTACLKEIKEVSIRRCGNGLVDGATPIIIRGMHLASLATGQVLFEEPDLNFHRELARKCKFDEKAYLAALDEVPVVNEEQIKQALKFLSGVAVLIAEEGFNQLQIQKASNLLKREYEQRHRVEDLLAEERNLLSGLMKNSPDHIYLKDRKGRFLRVNAAKAKRLGVKNESEILGKTDFDIFSEEHAREAYEMEQRIIATGEPILNVEEKETWPDGRVTWVSTTKAPVRASDGEIVGIVGVSRDITARKKVDQALEQSEAKERHLNDLLRSIHGIQHLISNEPKEAKLLGGVCNILTKTRGYLAAWVGVPEPGSKQVAVVAHAGRMEKILRKAPITFDDTPNGQGPCGTAIRERVHIVFNDIATEPRFAPWREQALAIGCASVASFPMIHGGRLFGVITVKANRVDTFTEEEIELLNGLANEVAYALQSIEHRTERDRMEEMLRQAHKMEAIGQLAGGVAHDFNNILGASMLQIGIMKESRDLTPELRLGLEELEHGAVRGSNLTRQLLMFSRKQAVQRKALDLKALVDSVYSMLSRTLGEAIKFVVQADAEPLWVNADVGMIEQVIVNLCVNARDAMPGGGTLTLSVEEVSIKAGSEPGNPDARPGKFACLSATDSGSGIAPKDIKHIFEPFFTTKQVGKGTGLGLATVYGIVKQHEGWIDVESKVGRGTTFRIFLPVTQMRQTADSVAGEIQTSSGGETILVAEDDPALLRAVVFGLQRLGYRVLEAVNGADALQKWREHKDAIDLLLTDMVMPEGMSGLELAQQIQRERAGLKVIISSGYSSELNRLGQEMGADITLLPKPYHIADLSGMLRRCLDAR